MTLQNDRQKSSHQPRSGTSSDHLPVQDAFDFAKRKYRQLQAGPIAGNGEQTNVTPHRSTTNDLAAILDFLFMFVAGAWRLPITGIVVLGIGFVIWHHLHPLNEHSSCNDFLQASPSTQANVIQNMEAAHHDSGGEGLGMVSVRLFCNLYPNQSVDGVYNGNL